jgi:hypothetical protein
LHTWYKRTDYENIRTKALYFWTSKGIQFSTLYKLALILYNVPSSSAFIERFYSICGNVFKTKCGNFSSVTIIQRSILKANTHLLEEFNYII